MKQVIAARDRQVSLSALALLFSELVQYQAIKIRCASDLECELEKIGRDVGTRVIELLTYRNRQIQRESSLIGILQVRRHPNYPNAHTNLAHTVRIDYLLESPIWQSCRIPGKKYRK